MQLLSRNIQVGIHSNMGTSVIHSSHPTHILSKRCGSRCGDGTRIQSTPQPLPLFQSDHLVHYGREVGTLPAHPTTRLEYPGRWDPLLFIGLCTQQKGGHLVNYMAPPEPLYMPISYEGRAPPQMAQVRNEGGRSGRHKLE